MVILYYEKVMENGQQQENLKLSQNNFVSGSVI
jgi:hypothetical protein